MNRFERSVVGEIPLAAASDFFIKLKYGSAGPSLAVTTVLQDFGALSEADRNEILKEAGVDKHMGEAIRDMARVDRDGRTIANPDADRNDLIGQKTAAAFKLALEQTPGIQDYLAKEQEGMAAQDQNEAIFLRQRMQEMQQQQSMSEQGQQATAAQMSQLEQQIQASQEQIQMAQANAMQAQSMATQAQQGQLSAADESMRNAQLAAQMRMAYQQLRSSMMDLASQDPAASIGQQLKGDMPGAPVGPEAVSQGQPTQGPPSPEMGPAGQAPGAQAAPDAAPPEGESGNNANAESKPSPDKAQAGKVDIKVASSIGDRALGALGGAAIGAAGTHLMDVKGTAANRKKVEELEAQPSGGFGKALQMMQAKSRLAMSEVAEKHPGMGTLAGGAIGAGIGAGAAPVIRNLF